MQELYEMEERALEEFWQEENQLYPQPEPQSWFDFFNPFKNTHQPRSSESFEGGSVKGEFEMTEFGSSTYHNSMSNSRQHSWGYLAGLLNGKKNYGDHHENQWNNMTKDQQKRRIKYLWGKAKRFSNKVRLQARLQKMADQNLREMMIDDI